MTLATTLYDVKHLDMYSILDVTGIVKAGVMNESTLNQGMVIFHMSMKPMGVH